jgi:t-SNARE complex subunit (syntaxin)
MAGCNRKGVHISLLKETHAAFRIKAFQYSLSMTEMFEEFARLVIEEEPAVKKILDQLIERKRNKEVKKLSKTDAESLLNLIDEESNI